MPRGRVIALLTDFGLDDNYVGTMKAVIAGINPRAHVIDLCHGVRSQDIIGGAFLLASSYKFFPRGTIFVVVIDPGVGGERKIVCMETSDYIFLAPDNGVLGPVMEREEAHMLVEVSNTRFFLPHISSTFHGRDIFAPVAAHLSLGVRPARLGSRLKETKRIHFPKPEVSPDGTLKGEVIYVDRFGNLITNIDRKLIGEIEPHVISIAIYDRKIERLSTTYQDGRVGELVALIGSSGHLEVAINGGSASKLLNCSCGEKVTVTFSKD